MILLPTLPAANAENPVKPAGLADLGSAFAAILAGETNDAEPEDGKILPEGGKDLPVGLPLALQLVRKAPVRDHEKAEKPAKDTAAETAELTADEPEGEAAPKIAELLALAIEAPILPKPAATADAKPAEETPAAKTKGTVPVLPGKDPAEPAAVTSELKPGRQVPVKGMPASLAALAQHGAASAKHAQFQQDAQQTAAPEQAIAAAAEGTPAGVQDGPRSIKAARPQLRHEVTLELVKQAKVAGADKPAAAAATTLSMVAAQPVASDNGASVQGTKPVSEIAAQNSAVRPHEFAALVDRLVEARESVRSSHASLSVMHADFGRVSVQFGQDNGNLTVSLASNDPGFMPAVNAAVAADASNNGDAGSQGGRRDEDGQSASSRTGAESNTGERGTGRDNSARQVREGRIGPQSQFAQHGERKPLGGIFA